MQYTIILTQEPDDGGWNVSVPALPGCYTQGDTVEEALAMAKDVIELFLQVLADDGEDIPINAPTLLSTVLVDIPIALTAATKLTAAV